MSRMRTASFTSFAAVVTLCVTTALARDSLHAEDSSEAERVNPIIPIPTPAQRVWQDCEIGLLYCFDLAIAAEIYTKNNTYRQGIHPARYAPVKLDTDQWLAVAKAANAKYALFTATHFNGFMQWQSDA